MNAHPAFCARIIANTPDGTRIAPGTRFGLEVGDDRIRLALRRLGEPARDALRRDGADEHDGAALRQAFQLRRGGFAGPRRPEWIAPDRRLRRRVIDLLAFGEGGSVPTSRR